MRKEHGRRFRILSAMAVAMVALSCGGAAPDAEETATDSGDITARASVPTPPLAQTTPELLPFVPIGAANRIRSGVAPLLPGVGASAFASKLPSRAPGGNLGGALGIGGNLGIGGLLGIDIVRPADWDETAQSSLTGIPIAYHGGPIMSETILLYHIYYGNWHPFDLNVMNAFGQGIGESPWFRINTGYYDGANNLTTQYVWFAGTRIDNYSHGSSISALAIKSIIGRAFQEGMPVSPNAIYVVLPSDDVVVGAPFCSQGCGWHDSMGWGSVTVKYAFAGNTAQCFNCQIPLITPNGPKLDSMAKTLAHELAEVATDPLLNAWYSDTATHGENADLCAWQFGSLYTTASGAQANTAFGGRDWVMQQNLVHQGGNYCSLKKRAAGDLNGDQFVAPQTARGTFSSDILLTGGSGWSSIPIARSNGDGTWTLLPEGFVPSVPGQANTLGAKVIPGDFDGDGLGDVAVIGGLFGGDNQIWVARSQGGGSFDVTSDPQPTFAGWALAARSAVPGDFNNDGFGDIALVGGNGWGSIPVALSNGDGTFTITNNNVPYFPGWATWQGATAVAGDFDGDGWSDIALTGSPSFGSIPIAYSFASASFGVTNRNVATFPGWASTAGVKIVGGDFNGDGRGDIALAGGPGWNTIPVALASDGNGNFTVLNVPGGTVASLAQSAGVKVVGGDFDGDGRADIALTGISWWNTIPVAFSRFGMFAPGFENTNLGGAGTFHSRASESFVKAVSGY